MPSLHEFALNWWRGDLGAVGRVLDFALAPAELLYDAAMDARNQLYEHGTFAVERVDVPVISIGNIAVGGTGKTPVTAWLARQLAQRGRRPAILHGAYAQDEPALHREMNPDVPVLADRDRVASAKRAIREGASVLLLDDGFQHRRLHRDIDVVLVASETWRDAHHVLPRGPWREGDRALMRADYILVTRRTHDIASARAVATDISNMMTTLWRTGDVPRVAMVALRASQWDNAEHSGPPPAPSLAVAAIADPDAFVRNARDAGATIGATRFFPDHHSYSAEDARSIERAAESMSIVTTAKDWVKLKTLLPANRVWILRQEVIPEDAAGAMLDDIAERVA